MYRIVQEWKPHNTHGSSLLVALMWVVPRQQRYTRNQLSIYVLVNLFRAEETDISQQSPPSRK